MTLSVTQRSHGIVGKLAEYATRNIQCLMGDPKLFLMRKVARFELIRDWVLLLNKPSSVADAATVNCPSVFTGIDPVAVADTIARDGVCLGINLPDTVVNDIVDFANTTPCYINRDLDRPWQYNHSSFPQQPPAEDIRLASYMHKSKLCPAIRKLESDPTLLAIAAQYLGTTPIPMGIELCWSFPAPATIAEQLEAAQVFHYDLDDYRTIKFFFYLIDVDEHAGPHVYIRGSHRNKPLMHQLLGVRCASLDDQKIVDRYGAENVLVICGPAGSGFAEEVIGFHKGALPTQKPRLMLQLEYTINDYGNIHEQWGL